MADIFTSEVDICNGALLALGANTITSLTAQNDNKATLCNFLYANMRDAVLRAYPWNFAKALGSRSANSTGPIMEFDNSFNLPSDCLRVLYLSDREARYKVVGREIHTDETSIKFAYISRVTDVTKFDSLFTMCLVARMAEVLSYPITKSKTNVELMRAMYQDKLMEAEEIDSQEGTADDIISDGLLDVRAGGQAYSPNMDYS